LLYTQNPNRRKTAVGNDDIMMMRIPKRTGGQRIIFDPSNKENVEDSTDITSSLEALRRKPLSVIDNTNSSPEECTTILAALTAKRNKRLQRELTYSVQNPLALGLKQLTQTNASRAARYEKAILLRAKKPRTTSMQQVLKNDSLLEWDHPLLMITIKEMIQYQADQYIASGQQSMAQKLMWDIRELIMMLAEDQFILSPKAIYGALNSILAADPLMTNIADNYRARRMELVGDHVNVQRSIARITGYCIGYNFKFGGCDFNNCGYKHSCLLHDDDRFHKTMDCPENPNRWKPKNRKNPRRFQSGNNNNYNRRNRYNNNNYNQRNRNNYNNNNNNNNNDSGNTPNNNNRP